MTVHDIHKLLTAWAPKEIAWDRDNVGLQVGDMKADVSGIVVSLDSTLRVVQEAKRRNANLIVSHHPLLFRPPKSITPADEVGECIRSLIRNNISLYSVHTNLDFTRDGTSFAIADALGLKNVDFLHKSYHIAKKIVTFIPEEHAEKVRDAMATAGAGIIGNYEQCSFGSRGTGSFKGNNASTPAIGKNGKLESLSEIRLEMQANQWQIPGVIRALRHSHPYEEVAYDVYPLENTSNDYGMGVIGELARPLSLQPFVNLVKKALHIRMVRRTKGRDTTVQKIAACGGSGAELTDTAIAQGADAFITADVKYHDFHRASGKIVLIDAGHYETEHLVVSNVVRRLKGEIHNAGRKIPVYAAQISTNPIFYS